MPLPMLMPLCFCKNLPAVNKLPAPLQKIPAYFEYRLNNGRALPHGTARAVEFPRKIHHIIKRAQNNRLAPRYLCVKGYVPGLKPVLQKRGLLRVCMKIMTLNPLEQDMNVQIAPMHFKTPFLTRGRDDMFDIHK